MHLHKAGYNACPTRVSFARNKSIKIESLMEVTFIKFKDFEYALTDKKALAYSIKKDF